MFLKVALGLSQGAGDEEGRNNGEVENMAGRSTMHSFISFVFYRIFKHFQGFPSNPSGSLIVLLCREGETTFIRTS